MDYQSVADSVSLPCCVLSVEKTESGGCGEVRIVCANRAYKEAMGSAYRDNMLYYELIPRDNMFENYCFRSAVSKQIMHAYKENKFMNCWADQTLIPLDSHKDELYYCQFIMEFTASAQADKVASVPIHVAQTVIEASVMLMAADDVKSGVMNALEVLMEVARARAIHIVLIDNKRKQVVNFCEYTQSEMRWDSEEKELAYDLMQGWEELIPQSNSLILKNEEDLEYLRRRNPDLFRMVRDRGLNSIMLIPLQSEKSVIGYMIIADFAVDRVVEINDIVELVSFFIGTEIWNHLLFQKLDKLSHVDVLTGVHNRRAMQECVRKIRCGSEQAPYGVISIDLNGLKVVNDQMGHEAGDQLLIQAAQLLRTIFRRDELFRTGGDEFVVISRNITEQDFDALVLRMRISMEAQTAVRFAIGHFWSDGQDDTTTALRIADERMYLDKKMFYEVHPELKRK